MSRTRTAILPVMLLWCLPGCGTEEPGAAPVAARTETTTTTPAPTPVVLEGTIRVNGSPTCRIDPSCPVWIEASLRNTSARPIATAAFIPTLAGGRGELQDWHPEPLVLPADIPPGQRAVLAWSAPPPPTGDYVVSLATTGASAHLRAAHLRVVDEGVPGHLRAHYERQLLLLGGETAELRTVLEEVVALNPDDPVAHLELLDLLQATGDHEAAGVLLDQIAEKVLAARKRAEPNAEPTLPDWLVRRLSRAAEPRTGDEPR